jgi:hypothetical protein
MKKFIQDFEPALKKMLNNGYTSSNLVSVPVPSNPTSPSPTILAKRSKYSKNEKVTLSFKNPSGARVWISVQTADTDPKNIRDTSEAWAWPCGTTDCTEQNLTEGTFDIKVGQGLWRAYLITDMTWPYEAIAFTNVFSVGYRSVSTSKSSYQSGESVEVSFSNPLGTRVWIAVYPADLDPQNLSGSYAAWAWPCGSTTCNGDGLTSGSFNLDVGDGVWKVFMMLDMYSPFESIASSATFIVGGNGCENSPLNIVVKGQQRDCDWIATKNCWNKNNYLHCPVTCNKCGVCSDSVRRFVTPGGWKTKCSWVRKNKTARCNIEGVKWTCRETCGMC